MCVCVCDIITNSLLQMHYFTNCGILKCVPQKCVILCTIQLSNVPFLDLDL